MSRLRRYKDALISGYGVLGANILYTLASVPLALAYLSKSEFGLWATVTQIAGYMVLVDLGMSGSVSRILVDYKDDRKTRLFGSTVSTSILVGAVQGVLILLAGCSLAFVGSRLFRVPENLSHQFTWLLAGQAGLQAFIFLTRIMGLILAANQRYDMLNYAQSAALVFNYGALWLGFRLGWGIYSSLLAQVVGFLVATVGNTWGCLQLRLLPGRGEWGSPTWPRFKEIFVFGKDVFLFAMGSQMVNATQAILVAPCLGLEAAAVWSVCTRAYTVVCQLVWRILDYSATPLSEMLVRGENQKFFERFRSITILTTSAAVCAGVLFALCNQSFVHLWTKGQFNWSFLNDALLGLWLVLISTQRCHCGLLGVRKELTTVKYIYLAEGVAFLGFALLTVNHGTYGAIIGSSILATLLFSFSYGLRRTRLDFGIPWRELLLWFIPAGRLAAVLVPWAALVGGASAFLPPAAYLALAGGITSLLATALLLRFGLDEPAQQLLARKLPSSLQGLFGLSGSQSLL